MIRRKRIEMAIALHRPLAPRRPVRSRALEAIDALLAAQPDDADLLLLKGHLLDRLGEYEAARRMYGRVLRHNGANVLAAMDMGHSYYYAGRVELALQWYGRAIALLRAGHHWAIWRAEWEEAHWSRALSLAELGRRRAAIASCRAGLAEFPRSRALRNLLATFLIPGNHAPRPPQRRA